MKKFKKKIIISVISVLLVVAICVAVVFYPSGKGGTPRQLSFAAQTQTGEEFSTDYTESISTENSTLYVNKNNANIAVKCGKTVFNSGSDAAARNLLANVLNVTLRDGEGNSYTVNSTDNSVAFGSFKIEIGETVKMTFDFFEDEKQEVPLITVPMVISVNGGAFVVQTDTREIVCKDGYTVENVSFLPGLFSDVAPERTKSFYTVPDGCGAQIDLTVSDEKELALSLPVYGTDVTFADYSQGALLPCFAYTKGNVAATVIINEGDALSSINVKRYEQSGGEIYNTFTVTPYSFSDGKLVKGVGYSGVLSQLYYFTTEGKNDYNQVSSLVRENLVSRGYLPSQISGKFNDFPFFVTVVGSENGNKDSVFTTFENGSEIIALLKSRGVRSIALRFTGAGKDGLNTSSASVGFNSRLGGKNGYAELCDSAAKNNGSVWYDLNLTSSKASDKRTGADIYADIRSYIGISSAKTSVSSYRSVEDNISSAYKVMSQFNSGNICINDMSYLLYTDIDGGIDRQTALANLSDKTQALSVGGGLMLSKPAVYLMNQADAVFETPQTASCSSEKGVTVVPLLQMVLHGSLYYGTQPVNINSDETEDAVLKAIEYGASPSFLFTYDGTDFDYGLFATSTAKYYSFVKRMSSLTDTVITSHEKVASGVYKVTYGFGKVVYVNYNPSVVTVDGILISPKDFVII